MTEQSASRSAFLKQAGALAAAGAAISVGGKFAEPPAAMQRTRAPRKWGQELRLR